MEVKTKINDRIIAVCLIILFSAAIYSVYHVEEFFSPDPLGTKSFPYIVNGVGLLSAVFLFIYPESYLVKIKKENLARFIGTLFLLLFYASTFEYLGFIISSFFITFCISLFFGNTKLKSIIYAILLPVTSFLILKYALELNIPMGSIIQSIIDSRQRG